MGIGNKNSSYLGGPGRTSGLVGVMAAAALLASSPTRPAPAQHDVTETRMAMDQIFASLQIILPLSADPVRFSDPAERSKIEPALQAMTETAATLDSHAKGFDPGRRYLGRSLARDLRRALQSYRTGDYGRAEFFIHQTVGTCVACHSRLEADGDSPLALQFLGEPQMQALDLRKRAKLQIATRRFDDALDSLEELFASEDAAKAGLVPAVTQYLTVSVRVKGDFERPIPVLERLSERPDVWAQLRTNLAAWTRALREFDERPRPASSVAAAKSILAEGNRLVEYPADRRPLVHYLLASRVLGEVTAGTRSPGPDQAEAYYLLGTTETRIGLDFWRSPADYYLEQAIRLAPHSDVAGRSYALLEDETVLDFTGSGGTHLPVDVQSHLDELRGLAARPAATPSASPE